MDATSMSRVWRGPARLIVFLGMLLTAASSWALDVPPLTGRVVDLAHVLPARMSQPHSPMTSKPTRRKPVIKLPF